MNLVDIALFPGILFHEFSHFITCIVLGVKVGQVKFTSVTHQRTTPWKNFFIAFAPFVLGSAIGAILLWIGHQGMLNLLIPSESEYLKIGMFYWLGISLVGMCFPSDTDAKSAIRTLFDFYEEGLTLQHGRFQWLFSILTLVPLFVPLAVISAIMSLFASIKGLGLFWAVVVFFSVGFYAGLWPIL
ncbi:metalloprotease family protein [archaeon]|nr:metalloprotease family protein [archaeon]